MSDLRFPAAGETPDITPIDAPSRRMFFRIAMTIVAFEPLVLAIVLLAVGMPPLLVLALIGFVLAVAAIAFVLVGLILWKPWQRRYPPQPILPGAVSQSWQSWTFGRLMRMNNCITIIADEKHLHLDPFIGLRWAGCGRLSLPLDRIRDVRSTSFLRMGMTASIDGYQISGPEWCLKLAGPTAAA